MFSKKCNFQNFEILVIFGIFSGRQLLKFLKLKINKFAQKLTYLKLKINGAKHSPSPSTLGRPSAGFGGPRAGAFFWHFESNFLTDKVNYSRNPQRIF